MIALLTHGAISDAQAQQPISAGQQSANPSGWTFNIAPYAWMPRVNVTNEFNLRPTLGGTLSSSASGGRHHRPLSQDSARSRFRHLQKLMGNSRWMRYPPSLFVRAILGIQASERLP
jgi:hypothetical protein